MSFRNRSAGAPSNEELCATSTGEGYSFKVVTGPSSPAGTSACSAHLPVCGDTLPAGYDFTSPTDPSACRFLTIRTPIAGTVDGELTKDGAFDSRLRLMTARSTDSGVSFSSLHDVTTSVTSGSTIIRGLPEFSDVKIVCAIQFGGGSVRVPALGPWGMVIMSLLLLTASSVLLARRRPVLAGSPSGGPPGAGSLPLFVPDVFGNVLAGTMALGLLALAALVFLGRALSPTDIVGSLVSAGILVYLVHLWIVMARGFSPGEKEDR